jgi:periplasmic protein TonB
MASSAEIMQPLPETLPDDFSEWDNGFSTAAQPANFAAAVSGHPAARPRPQSANTQYTAVAVVDDSAPRFTAGSFDATDEFLLRSFRLKEAREISPKRSTRKRTAAIVVAIVPILLLLAFFPGVYSGLRFRLARMKQSIATPSKSTEMDLAADTSKPSPSQLADVEQPSSIASNPLPSAKPSPGADLATHSFKEATPPPVESKMMTDQLTATAQIPHEITKTAPDEAPPASGLGGAGVEGLDTGGANLVRSVLSVDNNGPIVSPAPPKVSVSSGVAAGMFLHGAKPQYPAIAMSVHAFGTVVLKATISKEGTIENLRVNSGPLVLRQAAMDAVSTWRYRPYLLNGQPVAIDTTISVVFTPPGE